MPNVYAYAAVALLAAAGAVIIWLSGKTEEKPHRKRNARRDSPPLLRNLSNSLCIVCCENSPEILFLPCRHSCFCRNCFLTFRQKVSNKCPNCRRFVDNWE